MINNINLKNPSVDYIEADHAYQHKVSKEPYVAMSTLSDFFPKDYLMKWAVTLTCNYIENNLKSGLVYSNLDIKTIAKDAGIAYLQEQKKATSFGKKCHDWIEKHIEKKDELIPPEILKPINAFLDWEEQNVNEWLASEIVVSWDEIKAAGRLDAIALFKNGTTGIIDFKTSNQISPSYILQLTGYWAGVKELGFEADSRIVLPFPKKETRKIWNKKTRRYFLQKDTLEEYLIASSIKDDIEIIKCQKKLYNWLKKHE